MRPKDLISRVALIGFAMVSFLGNEKVHAQESAGTTFILMPNQKELVETELTEKNIDEVSALLHSAVPAANLKCTLRVRQIKQTRKFLAGERLVEMLEIDYSNNGGYGGISMKTYFPVGSKLTHSIANSEFSGVVEELKLESADRLDHWLRIQHDGRGHLVWAEMGSIFEVNPCQLR